MAEELKNWETTCNRFVAFLDIMGFKDRLQRDGHEKVREMFEYLRPTIELLEKLEKKEIIFSKDKPEYNVKPVLFSDSIILISKDSSCDSANDILLAVELVLDKAIHRGVPIKGAIAYGKQTADFKKSIYFGRPLIDAFELQNELLMYGIVLHHTFEKHLAELNNIGSFADDNIIKYHVPLKNGKIFHYVIDWMPLPKDKENSIGLISQLYTTVSGKPRIYVDNTLEFVRWVTEKKSEQKQK